MRKDRSFSFTIIHAMSLIKVKGRNTFEWKICTYEKSARSGIFAIEQYDVEVICCRNFDTKYQFCLKSYQPSIFPVSYTFSILDRKGYVFVTSKGKILKDGTNDERLLLITDISYLNACNLIESGIFTVRFSVHLEQDTQEGSHRTTVRKYDNATKCGLVWRANSVAYRCRSCGISPDMSLCSDCFQRGDHTGHDFNIFRSQAGGFCDCGDKRAMRESGFCPMHRPQNRDYSEPAEVSNVADSTTNANPLVTKDSSTNTAEVSNVADSSTNTNPLVTKDSSTNTDRDNVRLLETLSNDFSTFYENDTDTDCVLRVSNAQFHVHRTVLSARSSVFSAMFHHDTTESRSGEVNIPDVKTTVLGDVLYYVYSGEIKGLTANTAAPMYTAADKYDLPALRTECFEFLKSNLTLGNFCEVALLAHIHGEMELEKRVVLFIEENSEEVFESNTWQQFLKEKNLIASKLLMSVFRISKKKQFRDITSK